MGDQQRYQFALADARRDRVGLLRKLTQPFRRQPPPHYTEPPLTDAERDARLARLLREIER